MSDGASRNMGSNDYRWGNVWLMDINSSGVIYCDQFSPTEPYGNIYIEKAELDLIKTLYMDDDCYIQVGRDSDGSLPTPSSYYRGKMIRVEGGAGVADKLYCCMKKADDTYAWVQIASG